MKKINEMMISAYLKGMSKLNAFKDNESGEVNMVAIVLIIIVVIALVAVFKDGISDVLSAAFCCGLIRYKQNIQTHKHKFL